MQVGRDNPVRWLIEIHKLTDVFKLNTLYGLYWSNKLLMDQYLETYSFSSFICFMAFFSGCVCMSFKNNRSEVCKQRCTVTEAFSDCVLIFLSKYRFTKRCGALVCQGLEEIGSPEFCSAETYLCLCVQ